MLLWTVISALQTHLTFGKEFTEAVEMKQVAQQEAERARFIVEKVLYPSEKLLFGNSSLYLCHSISWRMFHSPGVAQNHDANMVHSSQIFRQLSTKSALR